MSWLTPERRAQFQKLSQDMQSTPDSNQVDDKHSPPQSFAQNGHSSFGGQDQNVQSNNKAKDVSDDYSKDQVIGVPVNQQSSGNLAKIFHGYGADSPYRNRVSGTMSEPAITTVHDLYENAYEATDEDHLLFEQKRLPPNKSKTVQTRKQGGKTGQTSSHNTKTRSQKSKTNGTSKSAKSGNSVNEVRSSQRVSSQFITSTGEYRPPKPVHSISTTKTQQLRAEKIQSLNQPVHSKMLTRSGPNARPMPNRSKASVRDESPGHGLRIMNSRTPHFEGTVPAVPSLNAAERYRQFLVSSNVSPVQKRSIAKRRMVEKKMDDVFRNLSQSPSRGPTGKERTSTAALQKHAAAGQKNSSPGVTETLFKEQHSASPAQTIRTAQLSASIHSKNNRQNLNTTNRLPSNSKQPSRVLRPDVLASERKLGKVVSGAKKSKKHRGSGGDKSTMNISPRRRAATYSTDHSISTVNSSATSSQSTSEVTDQSATDSAMSAKKKRKPKSKLLAGKKFHTPRVPKLIAVPNGKEKLQTVKRDPVAFGRSFAVPSFGKFSKPMAERATKPSVTTKPSVKQNMTPQVKPLSTDLTESEDEDVSAVTSETKSSLTADESQSGASSVATSESEGVGLVHSSRDIVKRLSMKWISTNSPQ